MRYHIHLERLLLKTDVINWLGWQAGYTSYLEVATKFTGHQFKLIAPEIFTEIDRAMYRTPPDFDDGLKITYRTAAEDSGECLRPFHEQGRTFDLIFLDLFHTYQDSCYCLELTLPLLKPGGVIVVHDCNPTNVELTVPQFQGGEWMGQTYLAFLDFVRAHPELEYSVVDTDYGCGILWRRADAMKAGAKGAIAKTAVSRAALLAHDYRDWDTYMAHRRALLNLLSVSEFLQRFRRRPQGLASHLYHCCEPLVEATGIFRDQSFVHRVWRKMKKGAK